MTREELLDAEEYADIVDDITCELETKYGALSSLVIPQPSRAGPAADPPGVGLVFVQFAAAAHAVRPSALRLSRSLGKNLHSTNILSCTPHRSCRIGCSNVMLTFVHDARLSPKVTCVLLHLSLCLREGLATVPRACRDHRIRRAALRGEGARSHATSSGAVRFAVTHAQAKAQAALNGRIFGTAKVQASFFEEAPFLRKEF